LAMCTDLSNEHAQEQRCGSTSARPSCRCHKPRQSEPSAERPRLATWGNLASPASFAWRQDIFVLMGVQSPRMNSVCSKSSAQCQHTPRFRSPRLTRALGAVPVVQTWYSLTSPLVRRRASFFRFRGIDRRAQGNNCRSQSLQRHARPEHFLSLHSHLANWPTLVLIRPPTPSPSFPGRWSPF